MNWPPADWITGRLLVPLALGALLGAAALSPHPGPVAIFRGHATAPPDPLSRLEETGRRLYLEACAYCHGRDGDGLGLNASNLAVSPRDFTDAAVIAHLSEDHLFNVVKYGGAARGKSLLMPAWGGTFTDREIRALVAYVRRVRFVREMRPADERTDTE